MSLSFGPLTGAAAGGAFGSSGRACFAAPFAGRRAASAFAAGSAFLIVMFQLLSTLAHFRLALAGVRLMALVFMFALLLDLFLLVSELFVDFYGGGGGAAARALFLGVPGSHGLVPWIWLATIANGSAAVILVIHRLREDPRWLNLACGLAIPAIWMEKGLGLVVPGFVPTPLGEVLEYAPTLNEEMVSLGIWAVGALIFSVLARATVEVESGRMRGPG
jgi:Ni/Fe-hydrogenase subunit HybB-like protein